MVGLGRLERPTSPLSGVRSNHLSYRPKAIGAERAETGECTGTAASSRSRYLERKGYEDGVVPQTGP